MLRVGIAGIGGKMGQTLLQASRHMDGLSVVAGSARSARETDVPLVDSAAALVAASDIVVDFTNPDYSCELVREVAAQGKAMVCGTTGLGDAQHQSLVDAGKHARVLWGANMSIGVNLLMRLVQQAAAALPSKDADIEIVEMHHKHKLDAPSGTALSLGEAAAAGRGVALNAVAAKSPDGHRGVRNEGEIGFASLRGGSVVGEHDVVFAMEGERVVLSHIAQDRAIFAHGALKAASWLAGQPNGYYTMQDMLNI
jgi:4-hydroxy-tetrahydrodipicolinate reductase